MKLISITKPEPSAPVPSDNPEALIAYCARVSSPNQKNPEYSKLLAYCIKHGHWSPFQLVDMTLEIETTLAIAPQILRHRSFEFQQMSFRYSEALDYVPCEARRQDEKNRQNSIDDLDDDVKSAFQEAQLNVWLYAYYQYQEALEMGIAKECARSLLPLNTKTRLYMKGSVRSWIHYIQVRTAPDTQKEHRDIALEAQKIFIANFPVTAQALGWNNSTPLPEKTESVE
jgi:thymidylate synthase (FAD)